MASKIGYLVVLALIFWCFLTPSARSAYHILRGDELFLEGDWKNSSLRYERAVHLQPESWRAWLRLASIQQQLGNNQAAGTAFEQSLRLAPEKEDTLLKSAKFYVDRNDERARTLLRRQLSLRPSSFEALDLLSTLELRQNRPERAVLWLRKSLEHNPYRQWTRLRYADLIRSKEPVEALTIYRELKGPGGPLHLRRQAMVREGRQLLELGEVDAARAVLSRVVQIAPNTPEAGEAEELLQKNG